MVDVQSCELTKYPAGVLGEKAKPVEEINDNIRQLAEKMVDIMIESKGVGLAGPQAGVNLRIFVASEDGTRDKSKVYINPEIELSGKVIADEEGCLSLPGIYAKMRRYEKATVTATDLQGNRFTETGEGLKARIFQHECDHLDGTMIKDKLNRVQMISAKKKLKRLEEDYSE
ncbi:Peptide deformylase [Anaerohalosphaera lusitana]|uniref:Peptide deformylase n=1 Tax=Anaerohalosphaera lusitana TaxID=1936003 RepID=A0A1U9NR13_9BACT|nr:peptide deformylase [Anaerohalosphaera lusitana]AQT70353.1 Peptide deformylase [Anaerohalosphaera lusitana]